MVAGLRSLLIAVVVGACTSTPPQGSGLLLPLGTPLEAIVVSPIEGATSKLSVDAVGPDGATRHVATLMLPAEVDGHVRWATASEHGYLAVIVEPPAAEDGHTSDLVVFAVGDRSVVVPATRVIDYSVRWGPTGQLTLAGSSDGAISIVDVNTGATSTLSIANGPDGLGPWLADGSGFLVTRIVEDGGPVDETGAGHRTEAGRLGLDGSFTPGTGAIYQPTGVERSAGADGERLSGGHGDFIDDSGNFAGPVSFLTVDGTDWYRSDSRRGDPEIGGYVWDREGTGIWLLLRTGTESRLAHLSGPSNFEVAATIPVTAAPSPDHEPSRQIVGLSYDGSAVVIDETVGEYLDSAARVHRVDIATGSVTTHPGRFAGWADVP